MAVSPSPRDIDKLGAFSGQSWFCVDSGSVAIAATICPEVQIMAWVEQHGNLFHVAFRIGERRFKKTLKSTDRRAADALAQRIDERLRLIDQGHITLPEGVDLVAYLFSDGRLEQVATPEKEVGRTLGSLMDEYLVAVSNGSMESNTLLTLRIHLNHIQTILGKNFRGESLTFAVLQNYINTRSKCRGRRGKPLSATTIRKELVSFGALWTWATRMGFVKQAFPKLGLRYPKIDEKPPFQTLAEIERRIARGKLTAAQQADLWDCLYFTPEELAVVLEHVQKTARHPFIYPMVLTAAHTGARRSELIRMETQDIDFEAGTLTIRERKRSKGKRTSRSVPMSSQLKAALAAWLAESSGVYAFSIDGSALTVDEANHHLKWTLAGSQWKHVRGWHVFRHSFISNCASRAVDQRMIDDWTGHQTDEMRKRYRHLLPSSQRSAIDTVFG